MPTPTTAILLFSRTAPAEARAKHFGLGSIGGCGVARQLIAQTEATLARTGLPVFRSDETSQIGATFGQRLANALADVYERGYDRVLVVGNDCPSIRSRHLRAAAHLLAEGKNVLGPDQRGGAWLIGLQRKDFAPARLANLPWETAELYAELAASLPGYCGLRRLADLNAYRDLRQHWHHLRRIIGELSAWLWPTALPSFTPALAPQFRSIAPRLGRAPPR